jgi:phage FluMu gp28-like protein
MGEKVVEDAQRRYGSRIEGVLFTGPNKLVMATAGKDAFEDRKVRIPEGNLALRSDLHKLRKVASATGAPRFVAERDDDHADRTWAAFLGIHAAGTPRMEYGYQSIHDLDGDDFSERDRSDDASAFGRGGLW